MYQGCAPYRYTLLAHHSPLGQGALGPQGIHAILEGHPSQGGQQVLGPPGMRTRVNPTWKCQLLISHRPPSKVQGVAFVKIHWDLDPSFL